MGLLGPQQQRFVGQLAHETGLNPRVVGAWALAEQSGGAARGYEQRGYHNFLNIANTDSGPAGGAHSSVWRNPVTAAKATAEWLRGQGPISKEYGKPAGGIMRILSAGSDPQAQISAIARSGWASSGYNGGADLRSLYGQLSGLKLPPADTTGVQGAGAQHQQLGVQQGSGANPQLMAAIEAALRPPAPQPLAAQSTPPKPATAAGPIMPAGARSVPPLQPPPEASMADKLAPLLAQLTGAGEAKVTSSGPEHALTNAVPHGSKLAGFLPGGAELEVSRKDQGQDIRTNAGGPILAPGSGYVIDVKTNPGGFGNNYPIVHFTSGPLAGHDVYIGHTHSALPRGAHFAAGAVLSRTGHGTSAEGNARTPGWAEIGLWGAGGPVSLGSGEAGGRQIAPLLGLR